MTASRSARACLQEPASGELARNADDARATALSTACNSAAERGFGLFPGRLKVFDPGLGAGQIAFGDQGGGIHGDGPKGRGRWSAPVSPTVVGVISTTQKASVTSGTPFSIRGALDG